MAGEHTAGGLSDQLTLVVASDAPTKLACGLVLLGELEVRAPNPTAAVLGLLAGDRPDDPYGQPAVRSREVVVAAGDHG